MHQGLLGHIIFGNFFRRSAITHIMTEFLRLDSTRLSYLRVTSLSVTRHVNITATNTKQVFPDLQIFSFPAIMSGEWLRNFDHSSLHTIIFDGRNIDLWTNEVPWINLQQHMLCISKELLPSLHSVVLESEPNVLSGRHWRFNGAKTEESAAQLRDDVVLVEFE